MATLTISLSGSAVVNGSKSYTVSDVDIQSLLNWAASVYAVQLAAQFNPSNTPGFVPTNAQILLAWVQGFIDSTKASVQRFQTAAPTVPPPIVII